MPAIDEHVDADRGNLPGTKRRWARIALGSALISLLIFATATNFVQQAWPIASLQIGVYTLTVVCLLRGMRRSREHLAHGIAPWFVYCIPLWGIVQILAHTTASTFQTREAVLRWGALAAIFFLTQVAARSRAEREFVLLVSLSFAAAMAMLCLMEVFTSQGRVLWLIPSGYPRVFATFVSYDGYAQFVEIFLPIALWRALRSGWRGWGYALAGAVLYASVIGSASRAGAAACTAELLAIFTIGVVLRRRREQRIFRPTRAALAMIPLLAVILVVAAGWQRVAERFQQQHSFGLRRVFALSALDMAKDRPLFGYGLGTFPQVYQQHAIMDTPVYANHAHNDWLEFAADGGVPFLLLVLIPFAVAVPTAIRHPWGLGLIAIMLHACIDFPFFRIAVSGWLFALLALLYVARSSDRLGAEPGFL